MKKVTIALLFLATMPVYGTRTKKAPKKLSWKQYRQELANATTINNSASITQEACRKQQKLAQEKTRQAHEEHRKHVDSQIKKKCGEDLKEFCIKVIACGCLYVYLEHATPISNYFNRTKLQ